MSGRRVSLLVEVDLDPIPGFGATTESWRAWLQGMLVRAAGHYRPAVTAAPSVAELRNSLEACRNAGESVRAERDDSWANARQLQNQLTELRTQLAAAELMVTRVAELSSTDEARLESVRAAMNHPDVRCLCGHESSRHAEGGKRRCTESADRASWYCPCQAFDPVSIPARLLVTALSAAPERRPA